MTTDEPTLDRWGGQTTEDRIVSSLSRLEEALRARDGQAESERVSA